jgi:hypothetical protein
MAWDDTPIPDDVRAQLIAGDCAAKKVNGKWVVYDLPKGKRLKEYPFEGEPEWV